MNNMKQTAVDFIIHELKIGDLDNSKQLSVVFEIIKKAKQMEIQQIADAYDYHQLIEHLDAKSYYHGKQYYNETYRQ